MIVKKISLLFFLFISGLQAQHEIQHEKPRILLVHSAPWAGGDGVHTFNFFKMLKEHGYHVDILVAKNGVLQKNLERENYSFFTTPQELLGSWGEHNLEREAQVITDICTQNKISIVHCNYRTEVPVILKAAQKTPVKTVFTYHIPYHFDLNTLKNLTGMIVVDNSFIDYVQENHAQKSLGIKTIESIPPLFNAEKFITYKSSQEPTKESRKNFFKKTFNITINNSPIIAVVGNMYRNIEHKNYPLLFQAIKHLIKTRKKSVQVIIAGDGPSRNTVTQIVKKLNLTKYVYFLGFTDKIPDVLHHADMVALASSYEAFGIIFLEAGLMKKPAIGAWGTGAEQIIVHEKTGLLFKKDDAHDLSKQIERLIDNKNLAVQLGNNAYDHIINNFLPALTFARLEKFYQKILQKN